ADAQPSSRTPSGERRRISSRGPSHPYRSFRVSQSRRRWCVAERFVDRLVRRQNWMDRLADLIQKLIEGTYRVLGAPGKGLRDLLHGTTLLGHPLHPAVTDVPIGAWTAGVILDYLAVYGHAVPAAAGDIALLVGVIAALLATASGYTDFN